MKNKNVAALLALFMGFIGVHRFYLGQIGLGVFYCVLALTGIGFILGIIDFIAFLSMDEEVFDVKYNREFLDRNPDHRRYDTDFDRSRQRGFRKKRTRGTYQEEPPRERQTYERPKSRYEEERKPIRRSQPRPSRPKQNPYKASGLQKYRDFEFEAAIADFKKALQVDPKDIAVHFNMACTYSLLEDHQSAFFHLSRAVELGFVDFEKIKTHDALAFLRIQDEFDDFAKQGYRLTPAPEPESKTKEEELAGTNDLLEQLKKLGSLREKGLLTEEEFQVQKKKLLG